MLCRLTNRSFFALKCVEQMQCNSKNLQRFIKLQKQFSNENTILINSKSFTTCRTFYQGAEKLQEKRDPVSSEGYLKSSVKGIYLNDKGNMLSVNFGEAEDLEYPVVWLRDNCQCHECFDTISNSRVHPPLDFRNDIIPKTITSNQDCVSITWSDDHHSTFQKEWLCNHSFHSYHQMERLNKRHLQKVPWTAKEFMENLPNVCFNFKEVINDDKTLLKWLETLATVGITKLSGTPLERGQLKILGKRVSFIRKTHYGEEYYIKGDDDANNVAYKKGALQMHSDMPYYEYMPGVSMKIRDRYREKSGKAHKAATESSKNSRQMLKTVVLLHFISQSQNGGENIMTDGLNAIKQLPRHMYDILSKTLVDWTDIGFENDTKFHSIYRAPVLCEDALGNLERVNWSQPQRDSVFNVSSQRAVEWYEAFQEFWRILHDPKNAILIKNVEGDILAFDNKRVVHGRTDYTGDKRFLCGAFLDWDEIYSKIRVLRKEQNVH